MSTTSFYDDQEQIGVTFIALAGWASLLSVLFLLIFRRPNKSTFENTHMFGYFICLLVANVIQACGTIMSMQWLVDSEIADGPFCTAQGALKHAGDIATSFWNFVIAVHVFNLLFLRIQTSRNVFIAVICQNWLLLLLLILIGPYAIQKPESGPFYGVAGAWCLITSNYPQARLFMLYFIFFLSAFLSFILYSAVFLRVRGHLIKDNQNRWRLRFVAPGEEWKLSLSRDFIDNAMMQIVRKMVWYPLAYLVISFPLSIVRLSGFAGVYIPFWVEAVVDVIFNLNGFIDVFLFVSLERHFPDTSTLPLSVKRTGIRHSVAQRGGVVPFVQVHSEAQEKYQREKLQALEQSSSVQVTPRPSLAEAI